MSFTTNYEKNVFINCPFDKDYAELFNGILFTLYACGFQPRSALEVDDSAKVRIDKIYQIISECKYGIHDLSRTECKPLPRFNMPLELGIFLGALRFGSGKQKEKVCLILDTERYRYQAFCSDIAGQDIKAHHDQTETAIVVVRNWLRSQIAQRRSLPGGKSLYNTYITFLKAIPALCKKLNLDPDNLTYHDQLYLIADWLRTM